MSGTIEILKRIVLFATIGSIIWLLFITLFDGKKENIKKKFSKNKNQNNTPTISEKRTQDPQKTSLKKEKWDGQAKVQIIDAQDILEFDSIEIFAEDQPIGLVLKPDKETFVGYIEVCGINFNLLDVTERELLEHAFQMMLNGIDYPIQLIVQSRKIDIENYLKQYSERIGEIKKSLDKTIDKVKFLKDKGSEGTIEYMELCKKGGRIEEQYNYGLQLIEYVSYKCKQKNMLERRYYIGLSHVHDSKQFAESLRKDEILAQAFFDIQNKASSIIGALKRANLDGKLLTGVEIAELLYISYNKADSDHYKLKNALASGFSHLFTTAESVESKEMKRRLQELEIKEKELKEKIMTEKLIEEKQFKVGA